MLQDFSILIGLVVDHRDETDWHKLFFGYFTICIFCDKHQVLDIKDSAKGKNHSAAGGELLNKSSRYIIRCGGNYNSVKRLVLGPALVAIPNPCLYGCIAKFFEALSCCFGQRFNNFYGEYLGSELCNYGGLVS